MLDAAQDSAAYSKAAAALPELLKEYVNLDSTTEALLGTFLSPSFVREQWEGLLPQLEDRYRGGTATPVLHFEDVNAATGALGLPLPVALASTLSRPIEVTAGPLDPFLVQLVSLSAQVRYLGPAAMIILGGLIWLIGGRVRVGVFAYGTLVGAIGVLVGAVVLHFAPPLLASTALTSRAKPMGAAVSTWLQAAVALPVRELTYIALGLAVLALVLGIAHVMGQAARRYHHPSRE
jgi:hypothetical protein